jgi:hypothetical protein
MKCNEKYEYNGVSLTPQQLYEVQQEAISQIQQEINVYVSTNALDANKVISNLQKRGFINIKIYKNKFLRVPKGRFASDNLEIKSLREIERANENIKFQYGIDEDLITPVKSETGYNLKVNQHVVDQANANLEKMIKQPFSQDIINSTMSRILFEKSLYTEMGSDPSVKVKSYQNSIRGKVEAMILYKEGLLALMNNQLAVVNSKLKTIRPSDKGHAELIALKEKLSLRIKGNNIPQGEDGYVVNLVDEIAELKEGNVRKTAFEYVMRDITQLESLIWELENEPLTEKHLTNLVQIKLILSVINAYKISSDNNSAYKPNLTNEDDKYPNPLFTTHEWNLLNGNKMPLEELVKLKKLADSQLQKVLDNKYISRFNDIERKIIVDIANNDERVKSLFGEESLKYSKMFDTAMKDISSIDKFMGDNIVGTFSDFGPVPQLMRNLLQSEITKYMSKHTVWEEAVNKQQVDVSKELIKLGFGIGLFNKLGVSYKIFRQTADNVKVTGDSSNIDMTRRLVSRQSNKFMIRFKSIIDTYKNTISETTNFEIRKNAYLNRNNWLRKNTVLVDPRKLQKIKNNPDFAQFTKYFINDDTHENELSRHLQSEIGLNEVIDEQEKKIYDYIADHKRFTNSILSQAGVTTVDELNIEFKKQIRLYEAENNPFLAAKAFSIGTYTSDKGSIRFPEMKKFNDFIPRRYSISPDTKPNMSSDVNNGEIYYEEEGDDTGYYDENYTTIEDNPVLKKFYDLTKQIMDESSKMISPEEQERLSSDMFISLEKTFGETLLDPNVHILKRIVPAMQKLLDNITNAFKVYKEGTNVSDVIDPYDKTIAPRVRIRYISSNQGVIQNKFEIYSRLFINTLSPELKINFNKYGFSAKATIPLSAISEEGQKMISEWLKVPNTALDIANTLGLRLDSSVPVGALLHKFVVSQAVADETFNLPKILKMYSLGATSYAARNEAMPLINILKEHYNNISKQATNSSGEQKEKEVQGKDGITNKIQLSANQKVRTKAVDNMEKWFQRNTLENIKPRIWGIIPSPSDKLRMTSKEKKLFNEAQKVIDAEKALHPSRQNQEVIDKMERIQQSLGGEFAISAVIDQILGGVRFIGLGLNPVSAIKNFIAGKISNYINGVLGLYFTEDSLWRAEHVVLGSHAKLGFGIVKTKGARKVALLMTRFKVFQDATDEIYKSSVDSAVRFQKLSNWYFLQQRVEYVNQAPVLIAMLMDKKIIGTDGTESSVWDAMKEDGTFIENFATEENNKTWINAETNEFTHFKAKVDAAIKNIHGDYTTMGAPMDSDNQAFRAFMMFKRWMIRYIHTRFAKEHFDSELGIKYKGRFRSYNAASLSAAAVTMAFTFAGVNLIALGMGVGAGIVGGAIFSSKNKQSKKIGTDTTVDTDDEVTTIETPVEDENEAQNYFKQVMFYIRDFALYTGQIATQAISNPAKIVVNTGFGGNYIKTASFVKAKGTSEEEQRQHKDIQANLTEISFLLTSLMVRLILMRVFKMDDDEEEDDDETIVNTILNMAGSMINEISQFYNPVTTAQQTLTPALMKMSVNSWKLIQALGEYDRVYVNGPYSGRNKAGVWAEKTLLPAAFRTKFGFDVTSRQVYDKFGVEKYMIPVEKRLQDDISQVRSRFKANLKTELVKEYAPKEVVLAKADELMLQNNKLSKDDAIKKASKELDEKIDKAVMRIADKYCPTLTGYNKSALTDLANYNTITNNPGVDEKKLDKIYEDEYQELIDKHLKTLEESMNDNTLLNDIFAGEIPQIEKR